MKVAPQFRRYLESDYNNLEVDPDSIDLDSPEPDSSHSTRMELEELEGIIEEAKLPPKIMRVADKAPLKLFYSIAKKKGLDPLEEEVKEWAEDWTKLSFDLKFKFKRRRPYEVKKEHDIDFVVDKSDTSESPSYPSGHAMMAYGIAEFYKEKYPLMVEEWGNVADIIAHSRLQSGVHYPSDIEASKKVVAQVTDLVKEASRGRAALRFARQRLNSGKGVNVQTSTGTHTLRGPKHYKIKSTKQQTTAPASPPEVAKPIGLFRGAGQAIKNNPGKTAIGVGGTGVVGYKVSEDRSKEAALPNLNSILKATRSGLGKINLPGLGEKVDLLRARRNLGRAVKDLTKYQDLTGRLGQMPRIVIPKTHLDIPDLYRLGFQDSLIAVPELGQKSWTSYRHPLTNIHLHDHGKFLNMHVDSLPSLQMIAERNSLTAKARRKLMDTIPQGVEAWMPKSIRKSRVGQGIHDQVSGIGHAILEGVPGYLNYGVKSLNPRRVGMAEEIISKLPKNYLQKRYGITKVSSEQSKLAAPKVNQQLLKKIISGSNRGGFLTSGDNTPPLEADPNYTGIVPPKPKRKRQELEEIVGLVRDEIAKASPEDMAYSKLVASGLPMEEIVARELVDPFTSRDNWTLTPEEYKQFRYSVIKDKKKLYPVARPFALAQRYGIDLGLPEDVAQRNAREHPAFANFSYPSFHTARGTFLAETARDLVPQDQQQLVDDLIARIGRSRIQQGVHSHQDVEAGEAMGLEAAKIYKELGIKTSAYKDYRPRGTLYLLDGKGGVMADKPTADYNSTTPYFFPGGGIFEEEKVDRLPTSSEIVGGVEREALEELGTKLKNVRVLQDEPANVDMPDWWRERQKKKRGVDYKGIAEFFAAAERGGQDKSIYGADNDEFKGTFYPIDEVASALEANAKPGDDYYEDSMRQARLLRSLLEKTSSEQPLFLQKQANLGNLARKAGQGIRNAAQGVRRAATNEVSALRDLPVSQKTFTVGDKSHTLTTTLKDRQQINKWRASRGKRPRNTNPVREFAVNPTYRSNVGYHYAAKPEVQTATNLAEPVIQYGDDVLNLVSKLSSYGNLNKQANDLNVLTAVPQQNLDLIMRKGLYSQKAMLDDPEVMASFLAQRNADKAWKNDEQYDEKRFREQYDKRVELMEGNDAPLAGPSVFFTEPDPDKVSDPRHFVNKFDTQKLRVNLGKLLADIPETRITGAELIPSSAAENMTDEEFEQYVKDRRRDITPEEAAKYIATDPKELWRHYKDEYLGRYYAADVPHAFIRTPSGIIPPEYLEQVEKTSSAKDILRELIIEASKDPEVGDFVFPEDSSRVRVPITDESGDPVGFFTPRKVKDKDGKEYIRAGATYVTPGKRGAGAAGRALKEFYEDKPGLALIKDDNKPSINSYLRAGFSEARPSSNERGYTWYEKQSSAKEQLKHILKKKAALEDEFQPDLTPDDLKALGVYDQVYGDAPSEASMKEWPGHWINKQDPLGWLQWYDRYSGGRRTDDDERQMKRWKSFKARHLAQYLKKPTPRRAAALRNWGIDAKEY